MITETMKPDPGDMVMKTIKYFGAVGAGKDETEVFIAADAYSVETGETIRVNAGEYIVKNLELSGSWIFDDGASIYGMLNAKDNVIIAGNGLRLNNATIKKYLLEHSPDGDYGNAIKIGSARQPVNGTGTRNIILRNITIHNTGAKKSQSVEILGDVSDVFIETMNIYGTGAVVVHWGGDIGDDGHNSEITYSYHPHDISIKHLKFFKNSDGHGTDNGLILSACYNVNAEVYSDSAVRTLWIFPGDVYDAVAVERDRGKICTGINVRAIANSPVASNIPAIHISGIPGTPRTAVPAKYGIDEDASMGFVVEASINCGFVSYSHPLVKIEGVSNLNARINKYGSEFNLAKWASIQYSTRCNIVLTGRSYKGVLVRGVTCSLLTINESSPESIIFSGGENYGCSIETYGSASFTVEDFLLSENMIKITPNETGSIFSGMYLLCDGEPIARVTKSMLCKAGKTLNIPLRSITAEIPINASVRFALPCEGTTILGSIENFLENYHVGNGWGVKFDVVCINAARTGINFVGDYIRGVIINGNFTGTGHEDSTSARADIAAVASLQIRGLEISASFDTNMINKHVQNRFRYLGDNHTGIVIHNCYGTPTRQNISFSIVHSSVQGDGNQAQIYANKLDYNLVPLEIKTGYYIGQIFTGNSRNNLPPKTGYWMNGSRLYNSKISDNCAGYVCIESGAPGRWQQFS
ncbi:hypothetical protein C7M52_01353 [Mixta theicola]|nr:hypothetical protein [Mixta theicola]QHM75399.1 hypothetical protein C7M52_01353 [Mixta theicola]